MPNAAASPAFRASRRPGFTASWFATAQSIAITGRMWISRSRSGPGFLNTIEFYDPPVQVMQIDPVFQGYKIVVLDDVILVVDPATREIVDVIRA